MLKKLLRLLLLLVVILLTYWFFLREDQIVTRAEAKALAAQPSSKYLDWKGNEIHYTDEGTGETILLIHGFGGSYYNFHALSQMLKDSFRVICLDVPGAGLSDFRQSSEKGINYFEAYKEFFHFFLDTLQLDSMYVAGNSLGGAMAYMIAAENPARVKKLILLNSAGYELDKVIKKGAGPLRWNWFRPFMERGAPLYIVKYMVTFPFADKNKVDTSEFPIDHTLINREGNLGALFDMATSGQIPDTTMVKKVLCPTLVLWGKEDNIIPVYHADKFKRDLPNSRVKIYSPCGHMPMMEIPDSVYQDFMSFVRE